MEVRGRNRRQSGQIVQPRKRLMGMAVAVAPPNLERLGGLRCE